MRRLFQRMFTRFSPRVTITCGRCGLAMEGPAKQINQDFKDHMIDHEIKDFFDEEGDLNDW